MIPTRWCSHTFGEKRAILQFTKCVERLEGVIKVLGLNH